MTNVVPGFVWHPIDVAGRAKRVKGRGAVGHVAVSTSTNLVPSGTAATRSADWHWYNPKVGPGIQYIDLDLQCWASAAGNATLAAFESQGGMGTSADVNAEPWNDNQLENAARFYAHLAETEGAPLQVMPNSLPGSRGLAGHRLGIDPWRVPGGEVWSSSRGKICPGDAKMAQLPVIVSRANEIVHGSSTGGFLVALTDAQQIQLLTDADNVAWLVGQMKSSLDDLHGKVIDSKFPASDREGGKAPDADDMLGHILSTRAEVADLAAKVAKLQTGGVDAAAVAALVLAGLNGAQLNVQQAPGK